MDAWSAAIRLHAAPPLYRALVVHLPRRATGPKPERERPIVLAVALDALHVNARPAPGKGLLVAVACARLVAIQSRHIARVVFGLAKPAVGVPANRAPTP